MPRASASRARPGVAGPFLFLVVFGGVFALLAILLVSIVVGSAMRTAASPPDADARDAWTLLGALAVVAAGAAFFGAMFRLALAERRLGNPEVSVTPDLPATGEPLTVRVAFTPPFPVRVRDAWIEISGTRVPLSTGTYDIAAGTLTSLDATIPAHVPGTRLVVYVGIAWWPDWRVDLDL